MEMLAFLAKTENEIERRRVKELRRKARELGVPRMHEVLAGLDLAELSGDDLHRVMELARRLEQVSRGEEPSPLDHKKMDGWASLEALWEGVKWSILTEQEKDIVRYKSRSSRSSDNGEPGNKGEEPVR